MSDVSAPASAQAASQLVADAARIVDPVGVLSAYVSAKDAVTPGSAAAARARNELGSLARNIDALHGRERTQARKQLDRALEQIGTALSADRAANLVLFAGIGTGALLSLTLPRLEETRVTWSRRPDLRPLLAILQEGRPAGCALLAADSVTVAEWAFGMFTQIARSELPPVDAGHRLGGPSRSHPRSAPHTGAGFETGEQRDLFERRVEAYRDSFLADQAGTASAHAAERGWSEIVVAGKEELAHAFVRGLKADLAVIELRRDLPGWRTAGEVEPILAQAVAAHRAGDARTLLRNVSDAAAAGGQGVVGTDETLRALELGSVRTLIMPRTATLDTSRDGWLDEGSALADAIIAKTLEQGGTVVIAEDGDTSEPAALARW